MKKFLLKILIFCAVFLIIDKAFYWVRNTAPEREIDKRLELVINGEYNKDVIFLGSSRGARNIIASRVEDKSGLSCFNLSYPGSDVEYHEFVLRKYLKHCKSPELVVYNVDPQIFKDNNGLEFRYDRLYPLVKYQEIREELHKRDQMNYYLGEICVLHQLNKSNFSFSKKRFTEMDTIMECGSMPISFQEKNVKFKYDSIPKYKSKGENKERLDAFQNIQKLCSQNDVKLLLVLSPNYGALNSSFVDRFMKEVNTNNSLYTYDVSNLKYSDSDYFHDNTHLKKNGAEVFSDELTKYIKTVF